MTFDAGIAIAMIAKASARIVFGLIMGWVMRARLQAMRPADTRQIQACNEPPERSVPIWSRDG
jgi:hypothetical protein